MNKYIVLSLTMLSIGSAFGRYTHPEAMNIQKEINRLKRDIKQEERNLAKISSETKYRKEATKLKKDVQLKDIEYRGASRAESKQADIKARQQRIDMLKQELNELQQ